LVNSTNERLLFIEYSQLEIGDVLGEGSFGVVYKCRWKGVEVAFKQLKNPAPDQIEELKREAKLMIDMLPHPNVLKFYAMCLGPPHIGIITEYVNYGSLKDLLVDRKVKLKFLQIVQIAKDIATGMKHLTAQRVVHRDLSARNILVSKVDDVLLCKVADFGLSRPISPDVSKGQTKSSVGPLKWMSPESLLMKIYSSKSDVWSFGVTLCEILEKGRDPYPDLDAVQAASAVMYKNFRPVIPENAPKILAELLEKCFSRDPTFRPDFGRILEVLELVQADIESNPMR